MDGDDAVEFFERFAKEFSVDTRQLGEDWHAYFSPEGAGLGTVLCVFVPSGVFAAVLSLVFPSLPLWLWGIMGIVGWLTAVYYWQKAHPGPQISLQDLVDCARAGMWKKDLPGSISVRLSKYRHYGLIRWFIS